MTSAKLLDLGLDFYFQQQLGIDDIETNAPVRIMNVHRSGLQLAGDGIDRYIELSGSDYDLNLTVGDWALFNITTNVCCAVWSEKVSLSDAHPVPIDASS